MCDPDRAQCVLAATVEAIAEQGSLGQRGRSQQQELVSEGRHARMTELQIVHDVDIVLQQVERVLQIDQRLGVTLPPMVTWTQTG